MLRVEAILEVSFGNDDARLKVREVRDKGAGIREEPKGVYSSFWSTTVTASGQAAGIEGRSQDPSQYQSSHGQQEEHDRRAKRVVACTQVRGDRGDKEQDEPGCGQLFRSPARPMPTSSPSAPAALRMPNNGSHRSGKPSLAMEARTF